MQVFAQELQPQQIPNRPAKAWQLLSTERNHRCPHAQACGLLGQVQLTQPQLIGRTAFQFPQNRLDLEIGQTPVTLHIRPLDPLEGVVFVAAIRVHLCDLCRGTKSIGSDELVQCLIEFVAMTEVPLRQPVEVQ